MKYDMKRADGRWEPHPAGIENVELLKLRTKAEGWNGSIGYVRIGKGAEVPPHVHDGQDDHLLILEGRGTMRVADDTFPLEPGVQVSVPPNTEHEIFDVTEQLLVYDVFAPPTF